MHRSRNLSVALFACLAVCASIGSASASFAPPNYGIHAQIDAGTRALHEAHARGREESRQKTAQLRALTLRESASVGRSAERLETIIQAALQRHQQFWAQLRAALDQSVRRALQVNARLYRQWWGGLSDVQQRSALVQYYSAQLVSVPRRNTQQVYVELDLRQADSLADIQASNRQARRIFAASLQDCDPRHAAFYQRQLEALVLGLFELMGVTHESYWDTLDELTDKSTARVHKLVDAVDAVRV